ncbi:hypothetical protein NIES4072_11340 [Nostoc commune NIES-4072]|uniref:Uncharacterized protein n=1 Tax=Nostoc commune NIES-4072 TaxID=2005467 RepID=A0A2R5FJ75_NOSCO|nr:hypothetical protein NIES4070_15480 [Nostoc commune HK-02]GBG17478.1 hypothetical protein NIES4072_11340 [Nostoc commune NIES-4072]
MGHRAWRIGHGKEDLGTLENWGQGETLVASSDLSPLVFPTPYSPVPNN